MIASDLRQQLKDLIESHGDLEVVDEDNQPIDSIEYDNDSAGGNEPAFVVSG